MWWGGRALVGCGWRWRRWCRRSPSPPALPPPPIAQAWHAQHALVAAVHAARSTPASPAGTLLLVQHPPVYTLGAGSTPDHVRFDVDNPPAPLFRVERGGEVTYHGPGQLVLYPVRRGLGGGLEGCPGGRGARPGRLARPKLASSPRPRPLLCLDH